MDSLLLWLGLLACASTAAVGLWPLRRRIRLAGLSIALLVAPVLVVAENWNGTRIVELRDRPALLAAAALAALVAIGLGAVVASRRSGLVVPAVIAVLAFRIPVDLGGSTANLLLPLYAVLASALLAAVWAELRAGGRGRDPGSPTDPGPEPGPTSARPASAAIGVVLAIAIVLYALQAAYATDLATAVENVCFFYAPFATLFFLLAEARWDRRMLAIVVAVVAVEALAVVAVGFGQYVAGEIFWNDKVIAGNEAHTWFRVNSVFYDPNIMGRFLAMVMIPLAAIAAWSRSQGRAWGASAVFAVLLAGVVITFSQSSLLALLAGLLVLALCRWGLGGAVLATGLVIAGLALSVFAIGGGGLSAESTGRTDLISGGLELAADRPLSGYGSGSFAGEFEGRLGGEPGDSFVSHTEPVTVAAEQGVIGLAAYGALLAVALWTMLALAGLGRGGARDPVAAALLAAFAAMVIHSLGYAAFLIDPITWALLGVTAALAHAVALPAVGGRSRTGATRAAPV